MAKVPISLSMYDVQYVLEQHGVSIDDYSQEEINTALFSIGFEVAHIETEEVIHRPVHSVNNEPWFGKRFVSFERQDKEWMYGGNATLDNVISFQDDPEHRKDLVLMSKESNNTLDCIQNLEAAAGKGIL